MDGESTGMKSVRDNYGRCLSLWLFLVCSLLKEVGLYGLSKGNFAISRCWLFGTDYVFLRFVNDLFLFSPEFLYNFRPLKRNQHLRPAFATIGTETTPGSNGWFTGSLSGLSGAGGGLKMFCLYDLPCPWESRYVLRKGLSLHSYSFRMGLEPSILF